MSFIYYRCERCGTIEAPYQIEPDDDFPPQEDCECWKGPQWVRGVWTPA